MGTFWGPQRPSPGNICRFLLLLQGGPNFEPWPGPWNTILRLLSSEEYNVYSNMFQFSIRSIRIMEGRCGRTV